MKKVSFTRSGLTVSVSLAALCVAMPALADQTTTTSPGDDLAPVYTVTADEVVASGVSAVGSPTATATIDTPANGAFWQHQSGEGEGFVPDLYLENQGDVTIAASAVATMPDSNAAFVHAMATITDAVSQVVSAPNTNVSATLINGGTLTISSSASADATNDGTQTTSALARSELIGGLHQEATVEGGGDGSATVTQVNDGTYTASSTADATSNTSWSDAQAILEEAIFMRAQGNGAGDATTFTSLTNNGLLDFSASATSTSATDGAWSTAEAGGGEHGLIHIRAATNGVGVDSATTEFTNSADGTLLVNANALSSGYWYAYSGAVTNGAIVMKAQGSGADDATIAINMVNDGAIAIGASSSATSTAESTDEDTAGSYATTNMDGSIIQTAEAGGPESFVGRTGIATLDNTGSISIVGTSEANSTGSAFAFTSILSGILQESEMSGYGETLFSNSGDVTVSGTATANGMYGYAESDVVGIEQELFGLGGGGVFGFDNSGTVNVAAAATASSDPNSGYGDAEAFGYRAWGEPVNVAFANSGTFTTSASATSDYYAYALAVGMELSATWDPTVVVEEDEEGHGHGGSENGNGQNGHGGGEDEEPVVWQEAATNAITGTIVNEGMLSATASAIGSPYVATDGEAVATDYSVPAYATSAGIYMQSAVNNATLTNSGTIMASAITNDGYSQAYGILVQDFWYSPIEPTEDDVFTLVNDGGWIIARTSTDSGET